jgi:hypothetical protein
MFPRFGRIFGGADAVGPGARRAPLHQCLNALSAPFGCAVRRSLHNEPILSANKVVRQGEALGKMPLQGVRTLISLFVKGSGQGVRTLISLFEYLYPLRFLLPKESVIIPLHLIHPALNRFSRQSSASFFGANCFCSGKRMVLPLRLIRERWSSIELNPSISGSPSSFPGIPFGPWESVDV